MTVEATAIRSSWITSEMRESSSPFRTETVHVSTRPKVELQTEVIHVLSRPMKTQIKTVHIIQTGARAEARQFQTVNKASSTAVGRVENEQVFIPTPVRRVENEQVFIPTVVGKVENERVFVSSVEPKTLEERVYIPQPLTHGKTSPTSTGDPISTTQFAGAAKHDSVSAFGKNPTTADGSSALSMDANNISGSFQ